MTEFSSCLKGKGQGKATQCEEQAGWVGQGVVVPAWALEDSLGRTLSNNGKKVNSWCREVYVNASFCCRLHRTVSTRVSLRSGAGVNLFLPCRSVEDCTVKPGVAQRLPHISWKSSNSREYSLGFSQVWRYHTTAWYPEQGFH